MICPLVFKIPVIKASPIGKNYSHPNSNVRGYIGIEKNPNNTIDMTKNTIPSEYKAPNRINNEAKLPPMQINVKYLYNFVYSIYKASTIDPIFLFFFLNKFEN